MFKAHRLLYHSTLGLRVIKKKIMLGWRTEVRIVEPTESEHSIIRKRRKSTCVAAMVGAQGSYSRLIDFCIAQI